MDTGHRKRNPEDAFRQLRRPNTLSRSPVLPFFRRGAEISIRGEFRDFP
jgi:hypothetical protein